MSYNLIAEPWIPWRRRSGVIEWGTPAMLVSRMADDPVVAFATPRPDFDGAMQEFMIGLLTAAMRPADGDAWHERWTSVPDTEVLHSAFARLTAAFDLDGDGPRFFQDLSAAEFADADALPIEQLLIDAPGDNTKRLNKDLFIKRDRLKHLGSAASAMALLTMQTYAPEGGRGHRASMRGGGPLTTLVDPRVDAAGTPAPHQQPLWMKLWANVETDAALRSRTPIQMHAVLDRETQPSDFPWMLATRTSDERKGGGGTRPTDVHPLHAYFGLPRRIRLDFNGAGRCDMTARSEMITVQEFRMLNYGTKYPGWQHPLTPYYRKNVDSEWLPSHGQPGGVGWRDWMSLTLASKSAETRKAASTTARVLRMPFNLKRGTIRLHAYGFDMDGMKARGWTEALLPAFIVDEERQELLYRTATAFHEGANEAAFALLSAVKDALFQSAENANGDFSGVKAEMYAATESAFYASMNTIASETISIDDAEAAATRLQHDFAGVLAENALEVFDRWCPGSALGVAAMRRKVLARHSLTGTMRGRSKVGKKLYTALGIVTDHPAARKAGRKSRIRTEKT